MSAVGAWPSCLWIRLQSLQANLPKGAVIGYQSKEGAGLGILLLFRSFSAWKLGLRGGSRPSALDSPIPHFRPSECSLMKSHWWIHLDSGGWAREALPVGAHNAGGWMPCCFWDGALEVCRPFPLPPLTPSFSRPMFQSLLELNFLLDLLIKWKYTWLRFYFFIPS